MPRERSDKRKPMTKRTKIAPVLTGLVRRLCLMEYPLFPDDLPALRVAAAELRAMEAVIARAEIVHARYLRQWQRRQNKAEDQLGSALSRLRRASREG